METILEPHVTGRVFAISKTGRCRLASVVQTFSTSESGKILVAIVKPPGLVAFIKSSIDFTSRSTGILPMPLPISVMAEERSAALGRVISDALTEPICTNRMGTMSFPAFAPAIIILSALSPQR